MTAQFAYLSLKNKSSCCKFVTASKAKCGSQLSGVLGGGFFEKRDANLGLTPASNRDQEVECIIEGKVSECT